MAFRGLDTRESFILIGELDDATGHARAGLRALSGLRHNVEDFTAVLTLLSIASEKTLKIALGLHHLDVGQPWPDRKSMQNYGHNIIRLWSEVRSIYIQRLDAGRGTPLARMTIEATDADPLAGALLDAMSHWGRGGRFERLDQLSGQPQEGALAADLLQEVEEIVLGRDTTILADLADPVAYDGARARMNTIMVSSMQGWWKAHVDAWATGLLGQDARALSADLRRVLTD